MCFWFRVLCVISMLVWLIFVGISGRFAARAPGTSDAVFHQEEQEDFHVLLVSQLDAKWVLFIWINCYFWCFYCLYDEGLFKLEYIVFFFFLLQSYVLFWMNCHVFVICCSLFLSASYEQIAFWIFDVGSWLWLGLSRVILLV